MEQLVKENNKMKSFLNSIDYHLCEWCDQWNNRRFGCWSCRITLCRDHNYFCSHCYYSYCSKCFDTHNKK